MQQENERRFAWTLSDLNICSSDQQQQETCCLFSNSNSNSRIAGKTFLKGKFMILHKNELNDIGNDTGMQWENKEMNGNESLKRQSKSTLELAWKAWREFTSKRLHIKREKIRYKKKIEEFLIRLDQTQVIQDSENRSKKLNSRHQDRFIWPGKPREKISTGTAKRNSMNELKLFQVEKTRLRTKAERESHTKCEKIEKLKAEVTESQNEVKARLATIDGQNDRVRALKILMNVSVTAIGESGNNRMGRYPVPVLLKRLERRGEERRARWKEIEERKRLGREEREKRILELEEEAKAAVKAEAKRRAKEVKERRKLEKEIKEIEKIQTELAGDHNKKRLLSRSWKTWRGLTNLRAKQDLMAQEFHQKRLKSLGFAEWQRRIGRIRQFKEDLAARFHDDVLKKSCFKRWRDACREGKKQMQVAEDWNDLKLSEKYFIKWMSFTSEEKLHYLKLKQVADVNFKRKLKQKYLRVLLDFPKVMEMERRVERRKDFWRRKVQQILPDYRPPMEEETLEATAEKDQGKVAEIENVWPCSSDVHSLFT